MLQKLRVWILISLTLNLCYTTTDITLVNCPSQYNLTYANITTNGTSSFISFLYGGISTESDRIRVQNIVLTGDTDDLDTYIKQKMIAYIIVAGIMFPLLLATIFYCLFDKNWPPCKRFRRDVFVDPYTTNERRCMIILLLIFAGGIFSTGIISFTSIPKMKQDIDYTKCSIYNLLDITINGEEKSGWGGVTDIKNKIGNISSLLDSAATQVSTYFTNDDWLITDMTVMKNINLEIYHQNKDSQLITPNPSTTETNSNAGLDFPVIDSVFIQTGMGPNGTFNTMTDDIDRGLRVTETKSNQAYAIYTSANNMVQASETIQTNSVASQNTLSMYIRQLEVLNEEMDTFSTQYFNNYFSYGVYILQGVVGFVIISSLLILVGAFSTHFFEILECRYLVHCGWFIYGLMYFGVLVLAFISISLGSVGYNFCQYFNDSIYNESSYKRIGQQYSQNAFNRIDVCILGDGNSLQKFNIADEMKTVVEVFTNIQTYYDYDNPSSVNYIDLDISTSRISGWTAAIEKYRLGIYIDSRPEQTNDDNPNYAINVLNSFTNPSGSGGCSKDRWVFDKENCTDPSQQIYSATGSDANGVAISTTQVICISFNQKFTTSMSDPWTHSDFTRRYVQIRETCPTLYQSILYYGSSIINFRDSRISLYRGIKDDLVRLYNLNSDFNDVIQTYKGRVDQFYQSVATLNNLITNQIDGLIVSANCKVMADQIKVSYNVFCVNFMGQMAKIAICMIVLLISLFCGILIGSIFGVRHATIQMLKRISGDHQGVEDKSSRDDPNINRDKQEMFSEHSHSSEDQDEKERKK